MKRLNPITSLKALEILNKVHFFDNLGGEEKDVLTGFHSHFFLTPKGEAIINQGGHDQSFYVLLTGKVSVRRQDTVKPLATLLPGDCFGEVSFLTSSPRTTSVVAESNCIVFEIDKPTLNHLDVAIREKLKDNIIKVLVKRLDHMNETVARLSIKNAQSA